MIVSSSHIRVANSSDIQQIQSVRSAVKENILSNPEKITDALCNDYILVRGKGWVYNLNGVIAGFAIIDLIDNNVWALFVHPDYENEGIGSLFHEIMLNWYFEEAKSDLWLSTSPNTRAEKFYKLKGWIQTDILKNGEIKFEMTSAIWRQHKK